MTDQQPPQSPGSGPQPPHGGPPSFGGGAQSPGYGPPPPYAGQPPYQGQPGGPPPYQGQPGYGGPPPMQPGGPIGPGPDYLAGPQPTRRRRRRAPIVVTAAVVVALGASAGAYAAFSGGGHGQAGDAARYLPQDSVAAMSVNLDPGGDQNMQALKFFRSFPSFGTFGGGGKSIMDGLIKPMINKSPGIDFNSDVKPWLGSHLAVAAEPQNGRLATIGAVQVKDEGKAKSQIAKYTKGRGDYGYVFRDGYLIFGDNQAAATYAAGHLGGSGLKGQGNYSADVKALPSDAVLNAWIDAAAASKLSKSGMGDPLALGGSGLQGRIAISLRFQDRTADLQYRINGLPKVGGLDQMGAKVARLPNDTSFAMGVTGLGPALAKYWPTLENVINRSNPYALDNLRSRFGLQLPGDLVTLLGTRTLMSVGSSTKDVGVQTTTDDPDRAADIVRRLGANSGEQQTLVKKTADGLVAATNPSYADRLAQGGSLGDQDGFRRAVPDAAKANVVIYGDLSKLSGSQSDRIPPDLRAIKAFGASAALSGSTLTAHMRLVLR